MPGPRFVNLWTGLAGSLRALVQEDVHRHVGNKQHMQQPSLPPPVAAWLVDTVYMPSCYQLPSQFRFLLKIKQ